MLTNEQNHEFKNTMSNPTRSLGEALFYAAITGQGQTASTINKEVDRVNELVVSLIDDGVIQKGLIEASGSLGEHVQAFLDNSKSTDSRISELKELTKLRFLVNKVAPARTLN